MCCVQQLCLCLPSYWKPHFQNNQVMLLIFLWLQIQLQQNLQKSAQWEQQDTQRWNSSHFNWLSRSLRPPNQLHCEEIWREEKLLWSWTFNRPTSQAYTPWYVYCLSTLGKLDCPWCIRPPAWVLPSSFCGYHQACTSRRRSWTSYSLHTSGKWPLVLKQPR